MIEARYDDAQTDVPRVVFGLADALHGGAQEVAPGAYAASDRQSHARHVDIPAVRGLPASQAAIVAKAAA